MKERVFSKYIQKQEGFGVIRVVSNVSETSVDILSFLFTYGHALCQQTPPLKKKTVFNKPSLESKLVGNPVWWQLDNTSLTTLSIRKGPLQGEINLHWLPPQHCPFSKVSRISVVNKNRKGSHAKNNWCKGINRSNFSRGGSCRLKCDTCEAPHSGSNMGSQATARARRNCGI